MTVTVVPNSRWVSLTLTFPGVGSITRDKNIHLPIECDDLIANRLFDKFYARLYVAEALTDTDSEDPIETEPNIPSRITDEITSEEIEQEPSNDLRGTALDRLLSAINNCQTVEELQVLGFNATKASALLDATPLDLVTISQIVPAKILAGMIAKHE